MPPSLLVSSGVRMLPCDEERRLTLKLIDEKDRLQTQGQAIGAYQNFSTDDHNTNASNNGHCFLVKFGTFVLWPLIYALNFLIKLAVFLFWSPTYILVGKVEHQCQAIRAYCDIFLKLMTFFLLPLIFFLVGSFFILFVGFVFFVVYLVLVMILMKYFIQKVVNIFRFYTIKCLELQC